jgi:hypothetical protein
VIREGLFIFPRLTEVVDIDSTSWKSKMTVNMHLFRGNKSVQMKKKFSRVFKHLYWNSSTFKSLILLLSFSSTFKDFKHLYEPYTPLQWNSDYWPSSVKYMMSVTFKLY